MVWTIEKPGYVIRDESGAVMGRYTDPDVMAVHLANILRDRNRLIIALRVVKELVGPPASSEHAKIVAEIDAALGLDAPLVAIPTEEVKS